MTTLLTVIPALAQIFSNGSFSKRVFLLGKLYYFIFSRKIFSTVSDLPLNVFYAGRKITFYLRYPMDLAVLREIFIEKEYDWVGATEPKTIVDLGAHFGDTTLYYHVRFPEAIIIAVEPSPENYARLVLHTKKVSNIKPVQAAVGGNNGTIELNLGSSSLGHSVMVRKDSHKRVLVPMVTLASLLQSHGIEKADIIKFDIEGAEFDLFSDIDPANFANAYIGELHFDLASTTREAFAQKFTAFKTEWTEIRKDRYLFHATIV